MDTSALVCASTEGRSKSVRAGKKIEKDAVGQTDNDFSLSLVQFKLVTLLATGP